ncbi:MAG: hypothetical protein FH758_06000 [Firmicutes bacterium]|nr:hypothetical protein [Bacillota bacterium]
MPKRVKGYLVLVTILALVAGVLAYSYLPTTFSNTASNNDNPGVGDNTPKPAEASEDPAEMRQHAKEVGANELGQVPILVYHLIGEEEGRWTRTPENFRRDLQELYDSDYVLVSLSEYISGDMDVPEGKSPAVITFDDSTAGHFRLIEKEDGETMVDPDSAVGILKEFGEEHPDFGHYATFFINAEPFGQPQYWKKKLQLLDEWGFEIGNHTYGHQNLGGLTPEQVGDQIVRLQEHIQQALPDFKPNLFAIAQDGIPQEYNSMVSGEINGVKYQHDAVLRWAWRAYESPFHKDYDPYQIQRIQVFQDKGQSTLVSWLDRISAKRYISDGREDTLAFPKEWEEYLKENHGKELLIYDSKDPVRDPGQEAQASQAKGVHVTFSYASSEERWNNIIALTEKQQMNTVQLDVKDESGRIGYLSKVDMAQEIGAGRDMLPIKEMLDQLRDRGIYSIARIVIVRDPFLAQKKPEYMVKNQNGTPLDGGVWVDPYSKEVWDYNIQLAQEAYELGFDEVQFDYIRFPEGRASQTAIYGAKDNRKREEVIADQLRYARSKIGWDKMLSATVFGFTGFAVDDMGIGQRPERMAPFVDYISPMVYPSHFGPGNYGFSNPNAHPYGVIDGSMKDFEPLVYPSGAELRPWLQAFTMGSPRYGVKEIQAQIKATEDNNIDSWLQWSAGVSYPDNMYPLK